nr:MULTISPECIES: GapR family DNA-binding domain-containing protein [unclassified Wolbachia]
MKSTVKIIADKLKSYIKRIEKLEQEKKDI